MEQLLEEIEPPRDAVFDDLAARPAGRPDLPGAARLGRRASNGVLRLLKAIRHDAPDVAETRASASACPTQKDALAQVMKTIHTAHGGKLSLARILAGRLDDGATLQSSLAAKPGASPASSRQRRRRTSKRAAAKAGDTVALGKLDAVKTGDTLSRRQGARRRRSSRSRRRRRCSRSRSRPRSARTRSSSARRFQADRGRSLADDDPQPADPRDRAVGPGRDASARHARAAARTASGVSVRSQPPAIRYRETIRKAVTQRGRHKKQSGGHGQFGDVVIDIKPLPRGSGFEFTDTITGGVGAAQLHPVGRGGRARLPQARAARLPGRRPARSL